MKRLLIAAIAVGMTASASAAATAPPPRTSLRAFECQTARDPFARGISVTAVMRPVPHTMRMALRFDLLKRTRRTGPATKLVYGNLGKWIYPTNKTLGQRPGDEFIVAEPVVDLVAPDYYKFRVAFRWIGAHNQVLGTRVRYSPTCFQPELRPDLSVASISVEPAPRNPSRDLYTAQIRNQGASAAGPFEIEFADGISVPRTKTIQSLGAHSKTTISFVGAICNPAAPPTVTVDPTGQVDDFNRANNALAATCPAS